jgi:hypothetical protein
VILDTIGGETHRRSLKMLKPGGTVVALAAEPIAKAQQQRSDVRDTMVNVRPTRERLQQLFQWATSGIIKPQVSQRFKPEDAARRYAISESGHAEGKMVNRLLEEAAWRDTDSPSTASPSRSTHEPEMPLLYRPARRPRHEQPALRLRLAQCGACTVHLERRAGARLRDAGLGRGRQDGDHAQGPRHAGEAASAAGAYVAEGVPQCGYCINGWIMTAAGDPGRRTRRRARRSCAKGWPA